MERYLDVLYHVRQGTFTLGGHTDKAEVIIFNRDLSPANKKRVDEYLSFKYKIPMNGLTFGADTLTGGSGADTFVWTDASHSDPSNPDKITDFNSSDGDKIDLSGMDVRVRALGYNALFDGSKGALIWTDDGIHTTLKIDMNGDRLSNFEILLQKILQVF